MSRGPGERSGGGGAGRGPEGRRASGGTGTPRLQVVAQPHIHGPDSTTRIMWSVVASLLPVVGAAVWFFGPGALLVIASATLGSVLTERFFGRGASVGAVRAGGVPPGTAPGGRRRTGRRGATLKDGSAAITGLLLGLTLPAGLPLWMAFVGGAFAIGFGKLIFGGLGQNVFNPALLGRAFLQAAFPAALTTWPAPGGPWWQLRGDNFALPLMTPDPVDAVTGATPLGLMKFEGQGTPVTDLFMGSVGGSLGETSALLILLGGAWLAYKGYLNWRIPVSVFLVVGALSSALYAFDPARFPGAPFMLSSGGLMLGAVYMATDMVTSPVTDRGAWVFGAGIGFLVVVIRLWGGLPEGVMYAILLMNAMVPFIDRATQPRVFGTGKAGRPAEVAP